MLQDSSCSGNMIHDVREGPIKYNLQELWWGHSHSSEDVFTEMQSLQRISSTEQELGLLVNGNIYSKI